MISNSEGSDIPLYFICSTISHTFVATRASASCEISSLLMRICSVKRSTKGEVKIPTL